MDGRRKTLSIIPYSRLRKYKGKKMILHFNNTTLEVQENDSSYRYRSLMGKPQLVLRFSLSTFVEIPVGAWCEFLGQKFTLLDPENIKKNGTRDIEYTITMGTDEDLMGLYKMRNSIDHRLQYSMCATPSEFIAEIVANLNERSGGGWSVGTCIDSTPKTIEFNHSYVDDALQSVAEAFETEWEIVDKAISLHKVEYFKDEPLPLSYGKGNGFVPGVGRTSQSDEKPIKRLYAQGGDRNIDRSQYGAKELLLPKNQLLEYEGRTYKSDADGYYIERVDKVSDAVKEDSIDLSEIYPSRMGTVSEVIAVKPEKNFYDIVDSSIPATLDYNNYLIEGETMTIVFQTGMLAGKEFDVSYKHEQRRFEIVPQEIDGQIMPNETFKPKEGDTYVVYGCSLPDEYVCDNDSKSGASWDMFREAARYMYEHEEQSLTFTGTLQGLYAKRNWLRIGGRLKVGAYILFSDTQFAPDGISIRITGIKEFLTSPYTPTIEISNSVQGASVHSKINHIDNIEVEIGEVAKSIISFNKRRFRDALQTIEMLQEAQLHYSEAINPITVQTMAALVGDESLQFRFVQSKNNLTPVSHLITYDNAAKQLHCPHGFLQHMTLGIRSVSSSHNDSEYKVWEMSEYTSPVLSDGSKKYYLYAKVSSTDTSAEGEFLLSETGIGIDSESGHYHLLVGVLNSELEEVRSYVDLYGFTEILPGRITTDRIVSSSGTSFFDMVNNAMKLGGALDFNTQGDGKLRIKGTIVQSESGDEQPLGVYRGNWNENYIYYYGDEVSYTANNQTATYRYINNTQSKGHLPTDADYWIVIAQGLRGDFVSRVFLRQNARPDKPSGGSYETPVPTGWSDSIPDGNAIIWSSICTFYGAGGSSGWSIPAQESDTDTLDIEFSPSATEPSAPQGNTPFADHTSEGWYDPSALPSGQIMIWRAERKVNNGVYAGNWVITRIYGEKGNTGQSSFKSSMFVRMNSTPNIPSGGSYLSPSPSVYAGKNSDNADVYWSDGIPAGSNKLWASTRIFTSDGLSPQQTEWTAPRQMTDTAAYDVEFAKKQNNDVTPVTPTDANRHGGSGTQIWFDPDLDTSEDFTEMYWRAERECVNGVWGEWSILRIKGEKGDTGDTGDFFEYRYAANGSTSTPPAIYNRNRDPSTSEVQWNTNVPSLSSMLYLWQTVAKISGADDSLVQEWSTPVRVTPYNGTDGKSPAMVFRGVYSPTKTYYGNENRVECVKFGSTYYRSRIDAPSGTAGFTNILPTDTDYWNAFGATFESVATDLLLAESASIGDWFHSGGKIVSTLSGSNKIELDASVPRIKLTSDAGGSEDYSLNPSLGCNLMIDGSNGVIKAIGTTDTSKVAYLSPSGIFSNSPSIRIDPATAASGRRGAIVGLGYGTLDKPTDGTKALIAGVFGKAWNSIYNGAEAYGGYFEGLKAAGLILNTIIVSDNTDTETEAYIIGENVSQVIGITNSGVRKTIYLPHSYVYEGQTIVMHQVGQGELIIKPQISEYIYPSSSPVASCTLNEGETMLFSLCQYQIASVDTRVWIMRRFSF